MNCTHTHFRRPSRQGLNGCTCSLVPKFQFHAVPHDSQMLAQRMYMHALKRYHVHICMCYVVSSPDPTLKEGKGLVTVEHLVGSCKTSILVFVHANHIAAL